MPWRQARQRTAALLVTRQGCAERRDEILGFVVSINSRPSISDATRFDYPSVNGFIFLHNPFNDEMLSIVLERLRMRDCARLHSRTHHYPETTSRLATLAKAATR